MTVVQSKKTPWLFFKTVDARLLVAIRLAEIYSFFIPGKTTRYSSFSQAPFISPILIIPAALTNVPLTITQDICSHKRWRRGGWAGKVLGALKDRNSLLPPAKYPENRKMSEKSGCQRKAYA